MKLDVLMKPTISLL